MINNIGFNITGNVSNLKKANSFKARNSNDLTTVISLRDADDLKYDVEYSKLSRFNNDVNIVGKDINIYFRPGLNNSKAQGIAYDKNINLEYSAKGFNPNKMVIRGKIDNHEINLKYNILGNNVNIEGDISGIDENIITLINMLARDFTAVVNNQITLATMIMLN